MHPVSGTGRLPKTERKMHNPKFCSRKICPCQRQGSHEKIRKGFFRLCEVIPDFSGHDSSQSQNSGYPAKQDKFLSNLSSRPFASAQGGFFYRKIRDHYATHNLWNLWNYWMDIFYTIPENLFFPGFFVSAGLADTTPHVLFRFVTSNNSKRNSGGKLGHALFCFLNIKDKKQNKAQPSRLPCGEG